jgi:thymidylate synthase (FAD)
VVLELVDESTVELIKSNGSDEDVAYAAWVSNFASEARKRDTSRIAGLIDFLYRERHMSPFEHGSFTYFIDTTIMVAREFMRHRTFSYNETSGRYKIMEGRFYIPPQSRPLVQDGRIGAYTFTAGTDEMYVKMIRRHEQAFDLCWETYLADLEDGIAKEVARGVLPLHLYTQFYATANPRNIMQFLILRNDKHALWEIQHVARAIEAEFAKAMPLTYAAYSKERDTWQRIKRVLELIGLDELEELVAQKGGDGE